MTHLYETSAINQDGVKGETFIKNGKSYPVSSPVSSEPGTNPEELLALAMSTCFNATVKALLKEQRKTVESRTETIVQLYREQETVGYYFDVKVLLGVESYDLNQTQEVLEAAIKRCPVSKLVSNSTTVNFQAIKF